MKPKGATKEDLQVALMARIVLCGSRKQGLFECFEVLGYCMDVQTLKENFQYVKKLTENDQKCLAALVDTEFGEAVEFMLKNNCKPEQEAMDLMEIGI